MNPIRIDVDRARRDAKLLLAAARAGDPKALAQLRPDRPPRLADAQHAIARANGYSRWTEFMRDCENPGAALRRAARTGDDDKVYELLEAGAPANAIDPRTGRTALLEAAAADQLDSVAALVGWVPVNRRAEDRRGRTALQLARPGSPVADVLAACGLGPPRPALSDEHALLADTVEVALLDHLSRAPGVERYELGAGFAVRTGLLDNSRNGVVCSELPDGVVVGEVIARLAGVPARWYLGEPSRSADLGRQLEAAGCRPERSSIHMAAELSGFDAVLSTEVTEVHDAGDLAHVDPGEAQLLTSAGPPVRHFMIGRVARLTTFSTGSTLLGVDLWVNRSVRRRGLARTLLRHGAAISRAQGCTHAVLAPTPGTIAFYERLGFVLERSLTDRWFYLP